MASEPVHYPNALAAGQMLAEYRIEAVLGVGGFGITYLARDTLLEKSVAIKEYFPSTAVSRLPDNNVTITGPHVAAEYEIGLDRFLKEARTLAGFSHPHIVRVNRYFKGNATAYMVMDYEDGESLRKWLERTGRPSEETLKGLLAPLLDGMERVHSAGFLHRDIKPDNIFVRRRGDPVLIDFGSARQALAGATQTLTALVSPGYAPFEQYSAEAEQGPWTDLYALGGVVLYAMTGKTPPDAISRMKADRIEDHLALAAARYDRALVDAVRFALHLEEKARPQSVAQWREALFGPGGAAAPTVPPPATTRPPQELPPPAATQRVPTGELAAATAQALRASAALAPANDTQDIGKLLERREQLERAVKEKFQRVLTVMFTDLKGSTAIAEASGDIAVRGMLKRYHDLCAEAIGANGGTLVKTIGDGSLSHFPDALGACRAAAAIHRGMEQINLSKQYPTLLLARIGMHTGECILEKNDVFGDVVNTAARFESAANPGEILISEDTYNALADKTEFYARFDREVSLKGKSMPFNAYVVFWDPKEIERDRARPAPAEVHRATPLWKMGVMVGVPILLVLAAALWFTSGGSPGGESRRSINYSVPGAPAR